MLVEPWRGKWLSVKICWKIRQNLVVKKLTTMTRLKRSLRNCQIRRKLFFFTNLFFSKTFSLFLTDDTILTFTYDINFLKFLYISCLNKSCDIKYVFIKYILKYIIRPTKKNGIILKPLKPAFYQEPFKTSNLMRPIRVINISTSRKEYKSHTSVSVFGSQIFREITTSTKFTIHSYITKSTLCMCNWLNFWLHYTNTKSTQIVEKKYQFFS